MPPVMAFHLGSLGFLTPFSFENFLAQVIRIACYLSARLVDIMTLVGHNSKMVFRSANAAFTMPRGIFIFHLFVKSQSVSLVTFSFSVTFSCQKVQSN